MNFPSYQDLFDRFSSKFREQKPTIDPTIKGSWSGAFGQGVASIGYVCVILAKEVLKQFNPLTATGRYLDLWASYDDITRLGESPSIGTVRSYGSNGTTIASQSQFSGDDNAIIYESVSSSTIQPQDPDTPPASIQVLTRSGTTATAVTFFPHNFSNGSWVNISGANESDYNGPKQISVTVISPYEFTYTISATAPVSATGDLITATPVIANELMEVNPSTGVVTITTFESNGLVDGQYVEVQGSDQSVYNGIFLITVVDDVTYTYQSAYTGIPLVYGITRSVHANVSVQSTTSGLNTTLQPESFLTYLGTEPGVLSFAYTVEGLQGGAEEESDESLRSRLLVSRAAEEGVFTNDQIDLAARRINGNTRVYIRNPEQDLIAEEGAVLPGQIQVYVLRDDDPIGVVPTGAILQLTKESIIEYGRQPASMWQEDILVLPPVLLPVNITLTNVVPDTSSMKNALKNQFNAYFTDSTQFGEDLDNDVLRAVVANTQDLTSADPTNSYIKSFDWNNVTEDVAYNEIPALGTLTVNGTIV